MLRIPRQPQSLLEVLKMGFRLGIENFWGIIPFTLLMTPLSVFIQPQTRFTLVDSTDAWVLFFIALAIFLFCTFHASIIFRIKMNIKNYELSHWDTLMGGLKMALPLFVIVFLQLLFLFSLGFVSSLLGPILGKVMTVIYMTAAIYFFVFLSLATFLLVLYDQGILSSLTDSINLVRGNWWRTFTLFFILMFFMKIIPAFFGLFFGMQLVVASVLCFFILALLLPLWYGGMIALVFDLKCRSPQGFSRLKIPAS